MIRSPIRYMGNKYRLLKQIIPLFPKKVEYLLDMFAGSATVSLNTNCKYCILNDIDNNIIDIHYLFKLSDIKDIDNEINKLINKFSLSSDNKSGYYDLIEYNFESDNYWDKTISLFLLHHQSFGNKIRFNKNNKFNQSFGNRLSYKSIELEKYKEHFKNRDTIIESLDYANIFYYYNIRDWKKDDCLIYLDPPYYNTSAEYNKYNWSFTDEIKLYQFCDMLNDLGIQFALSNIASSIIIEWAKKYNIHYLSINYNNPLPNRKRKKDYQEILITNYKV